MSRRDRSDSQLNAETIRHRDSQFRSVYERSVTDREHRAVSRPRALGPLLGWFRREWEADYPDRPRSQIHERGIEPDSQLGAPTLSGPMRQRLSMAVDGVGIHRTDYDRNTDTWSAGAAPRFPMLDALGRYRRSAPLLARYLEAVAYLGFDWLTIAERRLRLLDHDTGKWVFDQQHAEVVTRGALDALWQLWSAGQRDAGKGEAA